MASAIDFKKLNSYCPGAPERESGKRLDTSSCFSLYTLSYLAI
jgi:hypothetical protein